MANPQLEDGYTQIANEILDSLCRFKFNGSQFRIIIKILRLTYGYNRKDHDFSIAFLHEATGLSEATVKKELKALIEQNVLQVTKRHTRSASRRLGLNKDYEEWLLVSKGDPPEESIDLFNFDQVYNHIPNNETDKGYDHIPNSDYQGYDCTPNKRNKDLNKKDLKDMFKNFWDEYPRKVAKAAAQKAWDKLCKQSDFDPDVVIANTANFAATCKLLETQTQFILHPATYLNGRRWEDYPTVDPEGLAESKTGRDKLSDNMAFLRSRLEGGGYDGGRSDSITGPSSPCLPDQSAKGQ